MTTKDPVPEVTRLSTNLDRTASQKRNTEPVEDPALTDAEEDEVAELWKADRGNQGA